MKNVKKQMAQLSEKEQAEVRKRIRKNLKTFLMFSFFGLIIFIATGLVLYFGTSRENIEKLSPAQRKIYHIGRELIYYAAGHDEKFPSKLSELYKNEYINNLSAFESDQIPGKIKSVSDIDKGINYIYLYDSKSPKITMEAKKILRENKKDGITMLLSKGEITWNMPSETEDLKVKKNEKNGKKTE